MIKSLLNKFFTFLVITVCLLSANTVMAETTKGTPLKGYTPLEQIDGLTPTNPDEAVDLTSYLNKLYVFLISFAALAAVVMITIGGFTYLTSAVADSKSEGKAMIWNAISGLLLLLFSWLIINTINPAALNFAFFKSVPKEPDSYIIKGTGKFKLIVKSNLGDNQVILDFDDKQTCEKERVRLSEIKNNKYILPEKRVCELRNIQQGDNMYYFTYSYYTSPKTSDHIRNGSQNEYAKLNVEKVFEVSSEMCEEKRSEIVQKSLTRKPYLPKTVCSQSVFDQLYNQYTFEIFYPNGEKGQDVYSSKRFSTAEECKLAWNNARNQIEQYNNISQKCTTEVFGSFSTIPPTGLKSYYQVGVRENTPKGIIGSGDSFSTNAECLANFKEKETQKINSKTVSQCLQN